MYTFLFSVKMPKHAYKPSFTLSKTSKIRRRKDVPVISDNFDITQEGTSKLSETAVQSVHISNQTSNVDASNFIHVHSNELILVEQDNIDNIENGANKSPQCHDKSGTIESITDPTVFQSKLASFIVASQIPKTSATKLLKLLKTVDNLDCLKLLPLDSRTLLSTPRSGDIDIKSIGGGKYIHFGISTGLIYTLNTIIEPVNNLSTLELWFNVDGLPIDKKGKSFWPILCSFWVNNSIMKPFIVGAYFGSKKPFNVDEYLSPFITDINNLLEYGLHFNNNSLNIKVKGIIADAPARAFIKQIKGHSGYFGCEKCIEEGDYLFGSVSFPNGNAQLRTDESFNLYLNEEHHIGVSPLLGISGLGLVSAIPLDYMHLCCLGIMKKILHLLIRGSTVPNGCGSVRLSKSQIEQINNRMKIIVKCLSSDFARIPSDINDYKTFKATEFRQIMMYTGPYIFKNIVSQPVYNNFMIFNILMRLLSCHKTVYNQNDYAESLAKYFLKTFCDVYGKGNVSYNVHSLIHLVNDAKKYGVVDNFSSFPYENYLQHIKKIVQPGRAPLVQLYNRIVEERECNITRGLCINFPFLYGCHSKGPLPHSVLNKPILQYSTLIMKMFTIRVTFENRKSTKKDDCVIFSSSVICIVQNILKINEKLFVLCKQFEKVIPLYNEPCSSESVGMFECSKLSPILKLFPISNIQFKACYLPNKNNDLTQMSFYVCALLHIVT